MVAMRHQGYAVRVDWPSTCAGAASHDFASFAASLRRARRRAESIRRFWSSGPLRPLAVTVVPLAAAVFETHPPGCASLSCPTAAPLLGMSPAHGAPARRGSL